MPRRAADGPHRGGTDAADLFSAAVVQPVGPPGVEEALCDFTALRQFVGIDLGESRPPTKPRYASSATCWRSSQVGGKMLEAVNLHCPCFS
jgi:hypothetical protein